MTLDKTIIKLNEAIAKDRSSWDYALEEMTDEQCVALEAVLKVMTEPIVLSGASPVGNSGNDLIRE